MDSKTCPICGKTFTKKASIGPKKWTGQVYCSRRCFHQTKKRHRACPQCGKVHHASGRGKEGRKFCSAACYHAFRIGPNHPNWKGGYTGVSPQGYVRRLIYPDHPFWEMGLAHGPRSRYIPMHRLVMAEHLGRLLTRKETVHHINGDRADNRIENLQLRQGRHGKGRKCVCAECGSENIVEVAL